MGWTAEQRRAIEGNGNILVSAGAGSGKTAVLTERIVRLVREGAGVRDILCVTFTNAAAAEMKKRIERSLYAAAEAEENEAEAQRLHNEARLAGSASISTIDSFCNQVLHRHFNTAGLDPAFRIADENEAAAIESEVWDGLAEARYASETGEFSRLMEALGTDEAAGEAIRALYGFCRSKLEPMEWLRRAVQKYDITGDDLAASEEMHELLSADIRSILSLASRLSGERDAIAEDFPATAAFIDEELLAARALGLCETPKELSRALAAGINHSGTGKSKISWRGMDDGTKARVNAARKALTTARAEAEKFWAIPMEARAAELLREKPLMEELLATTMDFDGRFSEAKNEKNVIDYADMEHMALSVLQNEDIASEYSRRFKFIFLDEYQDCNAVQEGLVSLIARPGGLFLVGDVKQSIYRFRLAEPGLFLRRYEAYADGALGERIDLNANFRSAPGVLRAVNGVFEGLMTRSVAEIDYDERARLVHGREELPGAEDDRAAELALIDLSAGELEEGEEPPGAARAEASLAAARIREIMETGSVPDGKGGLRKPRYSDFAVLLRTQKNAAEDWMRALSLAGIPAYAMRAGGYFDAVEVRIFLELLRVIDNPRQDIPLAAVLRSPMGGFSTEELIYLRADNPAPPGSDGAWRCIDQLRSAAQYETALGEKATAFLEKLSRWRREARLSGVETLIGRLLDETDYISYCRALPGGRQREANLEALSDRARACAATGARSLRAFLIYTEKLMNTGAVGAPQTAGADVVRIMSVHASKGLEFPFVFIAGLGHGFNRRSERAIAADGELGIGAQFTINERKTGSVYLRAIKERKRHKDTAEEMRILYVAMTRARERLILLLATNKAEKLVQSAAQPRSAATTALEGSFGEWLLGRIMHSGDGNALRAEYSLPYAGGMPSIGINVGIHKASAHGLSEKRMGRAAFKRFAREAMALNDEYAGLFDHAYPFEADTGIPSKLSVTGLAGHEITMAEAPDFLLEERMSAVDRGTATHELMQHISTEAQTAEAVLAEADKLLARGLITAAQKEAINAAAVARFFASPLGRRLAAAKTVRREAEFTLRCGARELTGENTDASIILQGTIDCCFIENGAWVLIDYKTDRVIDGVPPATVAEKHRRQLSLYATALERLTGLPVRERYVFLLSVGEAVELSEGENG